jgi:adenylate cyclase
VLDSDEVGQLKGHFNLMLDGLHEHERVKDMFGRYVSVEIAEKIIKSGNVNLDGEEIEATVLFSDIRGFTSLSESLPPAEVVRFLNLYLSHITPPIMAHGGVINKFIGDAVMAIFSPVFGLEKHVEPAVRAALDMRAALADFNRTGEFPPVGFGVGLHTGRLVAGNVGTVDRREYTVLGDVVNVASRIESQTKEKSTDILVSADVLAGLERSSFAGINFDYCGPVLLRGKSNAIELFRLVNGTTGA